MKKEREKYPWYIYVLSVLVLLFTAAWCGKGIWDKKHPADEQFIQSIYNLDADVTAEDLIKDGYLDLTDVQPEKNEQITSFFHKAASGQEAGLKTFTRTSDGIVVRGLWRDRASSLQEIPYFSIYVYHLKKQKDESTGQYFDPRCYEAESPDGITEVWLKDVITTPATVEYGDYLLYRYRTAQ